MKLAPKNTTGKKTLLIIAIVVLLLGLGVGVAYGLRLGPFSEVTQTSSSPQVSTSTDQEKSTEATKSDSKGTPATSDTVPVSKTLAAKITRLSQDGENVLFSSTVENAAGKGTCVVTFTNPNDKPVVRSYDSVSKDSFQICEEVKIPALEFSYTGPWSVNFRFYSDNEQIIVDSQLEIK